MFFSTRPALGPRDDSVWPHRIAVLLVCATFPLLFIGGLVTSKGAGLAVPDWPTTFGYNMFLYPWSKMVGNIFYEHSHRLVASFVGLLTIALALAFWLRERRAWMRWLGLATLVLVIIQGVMGGLRVVLIEDALAIFHAATAQAFFALTICLAMLLRRVENSAGEKPLNDGGRLRAAVYDNDRFHLSANWVVCRGAAPYRRAPRRPSVFAGLVALHVILIVMRVTRHHADSTRLIRPRCCCS